MNDVETLFAMYGLGAVCLVMLVKAAGVPVPVPGDLIVLGAAAQVGQGKLILWETFAGLLLAVVAGGIVQFAIARGPGRDLVYRVARLAGLSRDRLDTAANAMRRRGASSLAVALMTPGVRNAAVPACGLAGLTARAFVPPLVLATGLDLALHFAIGAFGGSLLAAVQPGPVVVVSSLVVLAALGLAGWLVLGRHRRLSTSGKDALNAWETSACPVCLAVGVLAAPADSASQTTTMETRAEC